jgi:hypothetical protein
MSVVAGPKPKYLLAASISPFDQVLTGTEAQALVFSASRLVAGGKA